MADRTIVIPAGTQLGTDLSRISTETGQSEQRVALDALLDWIEDLEDGNEIVLTIARCLRRQCGSRNEQQTINEQCQ